MGKIGLGFTTVTVIVQEDHYIERNDRRCLSAVSVTIALNLDRRSFGAREKKPTSANQD